MGQHGLNEARDLGNLRELTCYGGQNSSTGTRNSCPEKKELGL